MALMLRWMMSKTIYVSAATYRQLGPDNKESQLASTISDFPAGSGHWLTEWLFKETTDHNFIIGHERRNNEDTFFVRIEKKEVDDE